MSRGAHSGPTGHTAGKWQIQVSVRVCLTPKSTLSTIRAKPPRLHWGAWLLDPITSSKFTYQTRGSRMSHAPGSADGKGQTPNLNGDTRPRQAGVMASAGPGRGSAGLPRVPTPRTPPHQQRPRELSHVAIRSGNLMCKNPLLYFLLCLHLQRPRS